MPRPKRPGKHASAGQWEAYWKQVELYQQAQNYRQHGHTGEKQRRPRSAWTPAGSANPDVGIVEGTDDPVSFKTGGHSGNETLISDGDYSDGNEAAKGFDEHHNHYGSAQEGGWIDQDRGFYTGPDH